MNRRFTAACLSLIAFAHVASAQMTAPTTAPAVDRWDRAIAAFDRADAAHPVAPGGILFVGSSTFEKWTTLAADMPGLDVTNRGVGGFEILDVIRYADRLALRYRPRIIVFYAGDNDLAARQGAHPELVAQEFTVFVDLCRHVLPDVRIAFVSVKPSPSRFKFDAAYHAANDAVREAIRGDDKLAFIDVATPMLGPDGQPRPELFVADRLHMTPAGYAIWTPIVRAQLDAWSTR